jgi:hypothetical protein
MFPEKYKHPSKQQKNVLRRVADKATSLFKRSPEPAEQASAWTI